MQTFGYDITLYLTKEELAGIPQIKVCANAGCRKEGEWKAGAIAGGRCAFLCDECYPTFMFDGNRSYMSLFTALEEHKDDR